MASVTLNDQQPLLMFETIIDGMRHVLKTARAAGIKRLLHTSSGAVYGKQPSTITHVSEDYMGAPDLTSHLAAYGEGKRAAELLGSLATHAGEISTVSARCFAFVGPHLPLDGSFAIGNFIRDGRAGNTIRVSGDGTPRRSYLYAADLATWLWDLALYGRAGQSYNVGSDQDVSIAQLAQIVADFYQVKVQTAQQPKAGAAPQAYVPNIDRASHEQRLKPWISLQESIRRTENWLKSAT